MRKKFHFSPILLIGVSAYTVYSVYDFYDYLLEVSTWSNKTIQIFIQIVTSFMFFFLLTFVSIYTQSLQREKFYKKEQLMDKNLITAKQQIEHLSSNHVYNIETNIWNIDFLNTYIDKLYDKEIKNFRLVDVKCETDLAVEHFITHTNFILGDNAEVIKINQYHYFILFFKTNVEDLTTNLQSILPKDAKVIKSLNGWYTKEEVKQYISSVSK